jgi:hypothetical protein
VCAEARNPHETDWNLPPVWSLLLLIRSAAAAEPEKAKGQSTLQPAVQIKEECMDALHELSRAADK